MVLSAIRLFPKRKQRIEVLTPNEPTFNASVLISGILILAAIGILMIFYLTGPFPIYR